ncbi:hypothetical protein BOTCAL_0494g00090 [Botryotinia calthae]|uniref:Uncharacterized protein n=1 Tax=Botryotinia calthae TaxID=38488 RepID=A0A4Y8CLM0_9HELO|nr:hypothetical protein BOTCAL_0494g00090 [Botryotinia calthae]
MTLGNYLHSPVKSPMDLRRRYIDMIGISRPDMKNQANATWKKISLGLSGSVGARGRPSGGQLPVAAMVIAERERTPPRAKLSYSFSERQSPASIACMSSSLKQAGGEIFPLSSYDCGFKSNHPDNMTNS